jgi:hypothetical protein
MKETEQNFISKTFGAIEFIINVLVTGRHVNLQNSYVGYSSNCPEPHEERLSQNHYITVIGTLGILVCFLHSVVNLTKCTLIIRITRFTR